MHVVFSMQVPCGGRGWEKELTDESEMQPRRRRRPLMYAVSLALAAVMAGGLVTAAAASDTPRIPATRVGMVGTPGDQWCWGPHPYALLIKLQDQNYWHCVWGWYGTTPGYFEYRDVEKIATGAATVRMTYFYAHHGGAYYDTTLNPGTVWYPPGYYTWISNLQFWW